MSYSIIIHLKNTVLSLKFQGWIFFNELQKEEQSSSFIILYKLQFFPIVYIRLKHKWEKKI